MGEYMIRVYMVPEQRDFIPTDEQYLDVLRLYVDKGLVTYSKGILKQEGRAKRVERLVDTGNGLVSSLIFTDEFQRFLEKNGFLEWFEDVHIHFRADGGFVLLDIGFYDPYFAPDPDPDDLEKFNKLVASDPRDIVEVVMDKRYDELNPSYDPRYTHFDNELADAIAHELEEMGIIDAIFLILGTGVKMHSIRLKV